MDSIAYLSAQAIEVRVCGKKTIEVDQLKAITEYPNSEENNEKI